MKTLEEAWSWYTETKSVLQVTHRLAEEHWDQLPWEGDGSLARDIELRKIEAPDLFKHSEQALEQLDVLTIFLQFSVFESVVRESLTNELQIEATSIKNPVIKSVIHRATQGLKTGSFENVLKHVKHLDAGRVKQIKQVQQYRNWVAHGRSGEPPPRLNPKETYELLTSFIRLIDEDSSKRKAKEG